MERKNLKAFYSVAVFLITLAVFLAFSTVAASALEYRVFDEADMLSDSERENIEQLLAEASEETGVEFIVLTSDSGSYYDESDLLYKNYVVFVIEYNEYDDEYYYYLDTYGDAYSLITDSEVNRILDYKGIYGSIKSGNIADGLTIMIEPTVKALAGHLKPRVASVLIPCMIAAFAVALTVCIVIYVRYKRKLKSAIYPIEQFTKHKLIVSRDTFAGSFVTRTRRSTSSGGSRSGGGSFGGSGGGGRRGGR